MIIPAGPHLLWVAYFFKENARDLETEDEVVRDVDCHPVIGWQLDENDSIRLPRPITQGGILNPEEQLRVIGGDPHKVRQEAVERALEIWRAAAPARAASLATLPSLDED
jgi:hypothetical protein